MKYKRFEEIPVWQDSIRLSQHVFSVTRDPVFRNQGDLANQLQRAVLSIPNNIAEGFERATVRELLQFLYIAKGSAGEVRSMCYVIEGLEGFAKVKAEARKIRDQSEAIARQLGAWAASQRDGEIEGVRYLSHRDREQKEGRLRQEAFLHKLKTMTGKTPSGSQSTITDNTSQIAREETTNQE